MSVLVAIARVNGSSVYLDNVRTGIDPFDEIVLEAAVRLLERGLTASF